MALTAGTRLGSFEILALLGAGGMGEVYRARDTRLGREVAIKALTQAVAADPERLARFRREAQTLASLSHQNIAAIYGLEDSTGEPYLVLELVEGETLAERLERGALPLRQALELNLQIAAAVEAAHDRGIVHRDLKPGNIMITPAGVVKVLDFGLAKSDPAMSVGAAPEGGRTVTALGGATRAGVILGTLAYMSPEQARGRELDRRSDVWSFGCVLFECLSGRPPFSGETAPDLLARILERDPDWALLPPGTPPRLRELLRRCLRKGIEERPRDIRDVRLGLAEIATHGTRGAPSGETSIAVLPFENLSGVDDEYFADGITDEILNALAQVKGLRVAARTSCFALKGKRENLRTVGDLLDVTAVLEGSVRRSGQRLRLTVQLVNVADGYQLWSERYDRQMTDVFEVQEEIAQAIATRLRGTLQSSPDRGKARTGTKNLEAYELLLKGRALQSKRGRFLSEAITCFQQAIALDPNYAEALAWLADSYRLIGTFGGAPFADVMPRSKALADRSLAIDPDQTEAVACLACVAEQYEWRFKEAAVLWERALAMEPRHARNRCQRALWANLCGGWTSDVAIAETSQAVQDDPLNSWVGAIHSFALSLAGRHEEGIAEARRAIELDAESFMGHWSLISGLTWAARYEEAIQLAPSILRDSGRHPWVLGTLAWTYDKAGLRDLARAVYDELEGRSRHEFLSPCWLATAAWSAGYPEKAIGFVERAVRERDPVVGWGRTIPFWDGIRTHTRFDEVTRGVWE
jgi:eukaryotic-like serine/threonine-protein kinase